MAAVFIPGTGGGHPCESEQDVFILNKRFSHAPGSYQIPPCSTYEIIAS